MGATPRTRAIRRSDPVWRHACDPASRWVMPGRWVHECIVGSGRVRGHVVPLSRVLERGVAHVRAQFGSAPGFGLGGLQRDQVGDDCVDVLARQLSHLPRGMLVGHPNGSPVRRPLA